MANMPEVQMFSRWIFSDELKDGNKGIVTGFEPEFVTKKGNKMPIITLWGTSGEYEGELRIACFNIANYTQIKAKYPDSTNWLDKEFKFIKKGKSVELLEVL